VSGLLVVTQAIRASKYFWAAGFFAIAVLFNPVVPLPLLLLDWVCLSRLISRVEDATDTLCTVDNQPGAEK